MITFLLVFIIAILNAGMDMIFNMHAMSIFSRLNPLFWDPTQSWRNKWKDGDRANGERFFGSSTFLVFLTDAWHLCKFLFVGTIFLCIVTYATVFTPGVDYLIMMVTWFLGFEMTKKLLTKK